ncbi:uncharacterized protein LOC144279722 [Eretmochelys imbricata]
MGFLLTAAFVFQTLLGNAAGEGQKSYENFFLWNYTFYFYDNYTYDDDPSENSTDYYSPEFVTVDYSEFKTSFGKDLTESAGSSLQGHLPFFVLLHLLWFLLQQFTLLL